MAPAEGPARPAEEASVPPDSAAPEPTAPEPTAVESKAPRPEPAARLNEALAGLDETGSPPRPPRHSTTEESDAPLPPGERRARPDYDGRPARQTDAGDIVRWVPRVLFFPAYLVMEYGLRTPIVWTVTRIEEYRITDRISDFFTWDEGRGSLYPLITFDFGIRPNAGGVFRWTEFVPRHDIALTFFAGPGDLWSGSGRLDQKLFRDEEAWIRWTGGYVRRPDNVFFGVSDVDARCNEFTRGCRYRSAVAEASLALVGWERMLNQITLQTTFRHARFSTVETDSPPLTATEAAALPGFDAGYQILEPKVTFALDSRNEDLNFSLGTGVRFEGHSAFAIDVERPDERWFRAGGEAVGFYDLGFGQVLAASVYYEGLENLGHSRADGTRASVPFYELPFMGGSDQMRGFLPRRLLGSNALAARFEYRYPITWGVDAALFGSIGNTFENLREWHVAKNYLSYGLSLRLAEDRVTSFEALLGWGSNRLDEPSFDPFQQFRLTAGLQKGF